MSPRIGWIDETSAEGRLAEIYARRRDRTGHVADIIKTFSPRVEAVEGILKLSDVHFGPRGALTRPQREMIATWVSVLLGCRY